MADDLEVTIARIEELAKKATRGPWEAQCEFVHLPEDGMSIIFEARGWGRMLPIDDNAAYIAAISPEVIQQMIEKLRTLEKERDELKTACACNRDEWEQMTIGLKRAVKLLIGRTYYIPLKEVSDAEVIACMAEADKMWEAQ